MFSFCRQCPAPLWSCCSTSHAWICPWTQPLTESSFVLMPASCRWRPPLHPPPLQPPPPPLHPPLLLHPQPERRLQPQPRPLQPLRCDQTALMMHCPQALLTVIPPFSHLLHDDHAAQEFLQRSGCQQKLILPAFNRPQEHAQAQQPEIETLCTGYFTAAGRSTRHHCVKDAPLPLPVPPSLSHPAKPCLPGLELLPLLLCCITNRFITNRLCLCASPLMQPTGSLCLLPALPQDPTHLTSLLHTAAGFAKAAPTSIKPPPPPPGSGLQPAHIFVPV